MPRIEPARFRNTRFRSPSTISSVISNGMPGCVSRSVAARSPASRGSFEKSGVIAVLSNMSVMETTAIEEFQMHGQDIPWLLEHWAGAQADHPALVWLPRDGARQEWTYAELLTDVR